MIACTPDPRLRELVEAFRLADDAERKRHVGALRNHLAPPPDLDRAAVEKAAAANDPARTEEILRTHFEAPAAPKVMPSGAWRNESEPQPILWRDDPNNYFADSVAAVGEVAVQKRSRMRRRAPQSSSMP